MKKVGFTLIELLIIVALLGLLAILLLAAVDPFEQIKKSTDSSIFNTANEVYNAIIRTAGSTSKVVTTEMQGEVLSGAEGRALLGRLSTRGELKMNFIELSADKLDNLYFTGQTDLSFHNVCFLPVSKSFKNNPLAIYDRYGVPTNCEENPCYICVVGGNEQIVQVDSGVSSPPIVGIPSPTPDMCSGFNPEYPDYPFTCNASTKWAEYSCTNYCVADLGCDSYCQTGQRHLVKSYSGTGVNFFSCLLHNNDTKEDYCVSGEAAGCDIKSYPSSDSDFTGVVLTQGVHMSGKWSNK